MGNGNSHKSDQPIVYSDLQRRIEPPETKTISGSGIGAKISEHRTGQTISAKIEPCCSISIEDHVLNNTQLTPVVKGASLHGEDNPSFEPVLDSLTVTTTKGYTNEAYVEGENDSNSNLMKDSGFQESIRQEAVSVSGSLETGVMNGHSPKPSINGVDSKLVTEEITPNSADLSVLTETINNCIPATSQTDTESTAKSVYSKDSVPTNNGTMSEASVADLPVNDLNDTSGRNSPNSALITGHNDGAQTIVEVSDVSDGTLIEAEESFSEDSQAISTPSLSYAEKRRKSFADSRDDGSSLSVFSLDGMSRSSSMRSECSIDVQLDDEVSALVNDFVGHKVFY